MGTQETDIEQAAGRDDLTPQELRNLASQLAAQEADEDLLAAAAGILPGRILASYFAHMDNRLKDARQRDAKARAETHYLALLQAQMDALDARIEELDIQIEALDELIELIEDGEPLDPSNPEHRRLLERSGVPEDQWEGMTLKDLKDLREARRQEREAQAEAKAEVAEAMERATPDEQRQIAKEGNLEAVREARYKAAPEARADIDKTLVQRDTNGNDGRDNGETDLESGASIGADDFFGPTNEPVNTISTAQSIAPNTPMRDAAPDMKGHYQAAASNADQAEPEAQANFQLDNASTPGAGLG